LTVRLHRDVPAPDVPSDSVAHFSESSRMNDPARAARVLYPLYDALMPSNVPAPDIQWEGGVMGDVYRIDVARPNITVRTYVLHSGASFGFHWQVPASVWQSIVETDPGDPATITIDRLESATNQ